MSGLARRAPLGLLGPQEVAAGRAALVVLQVRPFRVVRVVRAVWPVQVLVPTAGAGRV